MVGPRSLGKLAPLLYVCIVIAGKIFAAPPSLADLPQNRPMSCETAHAASSCGARGHRTAKDDGQGTWPRLRRTHIATSSSN
jgi:hypothetical protein